jgi:hypothetical protein
MVETWEHRRDVPMVDHGRRIPLEAREVEISMAEGEQALQALSECAREHAGEAHAAEQGIFTRRLPIGLAAMKLYCAQRGTGDVGPAIMRAGGVLLTREKPFRGRDDCSRFGTCAVARTGYRRLGNRGAFCWTRRSTSLSGATRTACKRG